MLDTFFALLAGVGGESITGDIITILFYIARVYYARRAANVAGPRCTAARREQRKANRPTAGCIRTCSRSPFSRKPRRGAFNDRDVVPYFTPRNNNETVQRSLSVLTQDLCCCARYLPYYRRYQLYRIIILLLCYYCNRETRIARAPREENRERPTGRRMHFAVVRTYSRSPFSQRDSTTATSYRFSTVLF